MRQATEEGGIEPSTTGNHHVCFIGGSRYQHPLNPSQAKKFEGLSRDNRIFVIGFSSDLRPHRFQQHAGFYLLPGVPSRHVRYALLLLVAPVLGLWCVARHGVDVLVGQSPYEACAGAWVKITARLLLRRSVALVVESHGDFERSMFLEQRVRRPGPYRVIMRAVARTSLRHADALRAVSRSTGEQLVCFGGMQPLVQFPTWSDVDVFFEAGRRRIEVGRDVLYAGTLTARKGVHHLIEAFSRAAPTLPGTRLLLVGSAPDPAYRRELERQAGRAGIADAVVFVGSVGQSELADRMANARVLVLPTYSEGLPRVVFEAMAAGTPVIASAVDGIPELLEEGLTGFLVPPGDEMRLAARLRTLLADADVCARVGGAARQVALRTLSTSNYFREYRRLFEVAAARAQSTGDERQQGHSIAR